MSIPHDYEERVYAGVLGKLIGVYLGRPFEGWTYEKISATLGDITYYVHDKLNVPLVVTDDDISGTFTFLRALTDHGNTRDITARQIGETWLNYLIERRTILWWGGLGNSTEHTAYLRLKHGVPAPQSGSIELNGKVVAEQIGSQIFIDGWAMVAPGDPEFAAELARRAASVSHDGEAIYGAQVVAAMEAQAFVEFDINKLIDTAVSLIPKDSVIHRMIQDIREWHASEPDWRAARKLIEEHYGYDTYGGNCHMVPNHALIIHSLLYGEGDFQKSLMIVNTSGWDTDCNSGNLGCLLGIRNGLSGIDSGPDWRGPVADKLYLPTADGSRGITDAVTETYHVVNIGRALAGQEPVHPKEGARFHFELPGSVQGFEVEGTLERSIAHVENVKGHSRHGKRSLAVRYNEVKRGNAARVATPTFIPSAETAHYFDRRGYALICSPTLHPGQTVRAAVKADERNEQLAEVGLFVRAYSGPDDELQLLYGPRLQLLPGSYEEVSWTVPETHGQPIGVVGIEVSPANSGEGSVYLDYLTWTGTPNVHLSRPEEGGSMWRRAWITGVDQFGEIWPEPYRIIQNYGRGLLIQGTREWTNYRAATHLYLHMVKSAGIAACVQGMRRYYALLLTDRVKAQLIKVVGDDRILAEVPFEWNYGNTYAFSIEVHGDSVIASINGNELFQVTDGAPLTGGGIALVCEEGRISTDKVIVTPAVR